MYFKVFIFLAVSSNILSTVLCASLVQHTEGDPELEAYLREAIENFREQMKTGIDAIHMPVLDPLVLRNLDINVDESAATIQLKIREMTTTGLSNFTVRHLVSNLEEFYLDISVHLSTLMLEGDYNLNSMVYKIIPIYGNGSFWIHALNITVSGLGQLSFESGDLQMTTINLDLDWGNMTMNLGNFLGGGRLSQVLQRVIPDLGHTMFQRFKPLILERLNSAVLRKVNEELENPVIKKIIDGLLFHDGTENPMTTI